MDEATLVEDLLGSPAAPRPSDAEVAPERLRDNRDFVAVLSGQGISALGDAVTFTALPLLVFALTGSGVAMGVVAALETLPDLIVGLPAGALADRWDRRRMMLFADLGRGLLTA
ncbi:MAG: MFS transporter, partial [Candidatus Limnocylindrales bacterium]